MFGLGKGNKRNRNRRPDRPRTRARFAPPRWIAEFDWKRWTGTALAVAVVLGAIGIVRMALDQPIQTVSLAGRFQRVSPMDVEKAVRAVARGKGLVGVDLRTVADAVRQIPWVDSVSVGRSWPRGISVHVIEQVPVARWGDKGLLNARGEVFVNDPGRLPDELPELVGPPGTEAAVTRQYLAVHGRITEAGLRLTRMQLDPRGAWEYSLDSGVVLRLGRRQVDERFDRFLTSGTRVLSTRGQEIAYIDLRYSNGFAVGMRN
jgi:cell division protein FtsQ